jgi:hypothetical protein
MTHENNGGGRLGFEKPGQSDCDSDVEKDDLDATPAPLLFAVCF